MRTAATEALLRARCRAWGNSPPGAFYVADLSVVRAAHKRFAEGLPGVRPHYAVKCNPDPAVLSLLGRLGAGFDCASLSEMEAAFRYGKASPDDIIYANPVKTPNQLASASAIGVDKITVDSVDEMIKVGSLHPDAQCLVRIHVDDTTAQCRLGLKYGATLAQVCDICEAARNLGVSIVGIAFHAGSGQRNPSAFGAAIGTARRAWDLCVSAGNELSILDIGGGFTDGPEWQDVARVVTESLHHYFPGSTAPRQGNWNASAVDVIAEPGRFLVCNAFTLATQVIGVRRSTAFIDIFINDSVYGSFNNTIYDKAEVRPAAVILMETETEPVKFLDVALPSPCIDSIEADRQANDQQNLASVWGQTCDGLDRILECTDCLPTENLNVGDWIVWGSMGAYTLAAGSHFNGFAPPTVEYVDTELSFGILDESKRTTVSRLANYY